MNRERLSALIQTERELYLSRTSASRAQYQAADHLLGRVPMTWMNKWPGGYPLALRDARGCHVTDIDGNEYVDFALGDTGAMAGHSPTQTIRAIQERIGNLGGITTMLPTADAEWVGAELTRRFGLPLWSFTLTATDANRWALRIARLVTGRPRILTFSYGYHGSVDETLAVLDAEGRTVARSGSVGPPVSVDITTRAAEFNDLASVERALARGDVAAVLTEPALTNMGIVLPEPGFLDGLRAACTAHGTLLIIDETHTISAGPGGCTREWGLHPDLFVIGKAIAGGVPAGAYGISHEVAGALADHAEADLVDVGGVGGTLAGNAMSTAAMRATLHRVLTDQAFAHMIDVATVFRQGVEQVIRRHAMPWSVAQLGARVEYRFCDPSPRTGTESNAVYDGDLEEYLHLYLANRGVLMTPFHNMALMCPETTLGDAERHTRLFEDAVAALNA